MEYVYRKESETSKYYAFRPNEDYEKINSLSINGVEFKLKITYKSVMKIIKLLSSKFPDKFKVNKILEILEFNEDLELETKSFLVGEILDYIFKPNENSSGGKKMFDMYLDYRYYYPDFFELGIDLNKDDIDWIQFDTLLEGILLKKESAILTVLGYRSYKKPSGNIKTYENEEHQYYLSKQRQYALPSEQKDIDEGFDKMWDYLEEQSEK